MAKIETVCITNNIHYIDIRKSMIAGARTLEDLKENPGVCGECEGCIGLLDYILKTLCGCKEVSMKEVQDLVKSGVDSLDEIMEKTKAATGEGCGRCQKLIENIIEQGY